MKKLVNRRLLAVIVIGVLIAVTSVSLVKVAGKDYSVTLGYGEHFYTSNVGTIGIEGFVNWSFSGSNEFVGIEVYIMDEFNFELFQVWGVFRESYTVSDGSYYDDFGSFDFPAEDTWYIFFFHNDLTAMLQTTTVDISVDFVGGGLVLGILLVIIIAPIVVVAAVITLIVVLVLRKKKQPIQPIQP